MLITTTDVGKALGKTFTVGATDTIQCQAFIDIVEAFIGETVGMSFTAGSVTHRLQADMDGIIRLPVTPVNSITSVKTIDGLTVSFYGWDGLDEIDGLEAHQVVDVVFNAGSATAPASIKAIATSVVCRQMVNPSGIRQQTVGAISETFAAGDGQAGTVFFTVSEREILRKYGAGTDTWRLGPRQPSWLRSSLPTL